MIRRAILFLPLILGGAPGAQETVPDFVEMDYTKMERKIRKEPEYKADPLYALFILDPQARFRARAVLDKSKASLPYYDLLYFDRNGNGDLTEAGEGFKGRYDESKARAGMSVSIMVGKVPVPGTKMVHTDLVFSTVRKKGRKGIWFSMKWNGEEEVSGGYGTAGMDTTIWSRSPDAAPVLRPTILGPLSFAFWGSSDVVLRIGKATPINLLIGSLGSGPDTLCALSEHFLKLGEDEIIATVIAKDREGKEIRARNEIRGHC